ncbi:MAG TPA: hypothetical protein VFB04_06980, partial [Terriglobales bacterium]|nr:hypothetical protein [Terriglobales bacterium]
ASTTASGSGCIIALDPTDSNTLLLNGNVSVSSSCGVFVNSSSSQALNINGNSGYLNAGTAGAGIGVVGPGTPGSGWSPSGGPYCDGSSGFCPQPVNIPSFTDPLENLAEPVPTGCDHNTTVKIQGSGSLMPGTYCGGISLTGNGTVTFAAGIYQLCGGGMSSSGGEILTGTDVTIYNTGNVKGVCPGKNYAPVSITGGGGSNLSAPTSGTYAGVLFFQDRAYQSTKNVDASNINGTAGATFTGAVYFPGTDLTYSGNPSVDVSSLIIAYQITINGNTSINDNLVTGGGSPIHTAALAE